jgi:tartrate-resistant acid phosphatase type 5
MRKYGWLILLPALLGLLVALAPLPQLSQPAAALKVAVIGDFGLAGQSEADVAELVHGWNPDFIITTGDNNYPDGAASTIDVNIGQYYHSYIGNYQGSYGPGASTNRFFPSLGNHDWNTTNAQPYLDYFTLPTGSPGGERYYQFTWGPLHLFALDSDRHEPHGITADSRQAEWLECAMTASTAPWQLVYMHHPPYSSGPSHGSREEMQWPYKEWGADAVFAGHDHAYERLRVDGLRYFVVGTGGASLYPFMDLIAESEFAYDSDYGAMLIEANSTTLSFKFYRRTGELVDSFAINKPASTLPRRSYVPLLRHGFSAPTPPPPSC